MKKLIVTLTFVGMLVFGAAANSFADDYYIVHNGRIVEHRYVYEQPDTSVNFVDPVDYDEVDHYYVYPDDDNVRYYYYDDDDDLIEFEFDLF